MTYQEIVNNLKESKNFSFSRFGDGEFNAILGASPGQDPKQNCDRHRYFKDMGMRLYKVILSNPNYVMGMQNLAKRLRKDDSDFHTLINHVDNWVDSDVLHRASIKQGLSAMFDALRERNIILVANEQLSFIVDKIYTPVNFCDFQHIVISPRDCWLEYAEVKNRLLELIEKDDVILYAASMMTEVLIDDIYNIYGEKVTQIDVGSAFDPYCGIKSRSYHNNLKV